MPEKAYLVVGCRMVCRFPNNLLKELEALLILLVKIAHDFGHPRYVSFEELVVRVDAVFQLRLERIDFPKKAVAIAG